MNTYIFSRWVYLAGVVLAVALVVPVVWFPFVLGKLAAFSLLVAVSSIVFVWSGGMHEAVRTKGAPGALLVFLLPLSYLVSWLFSTDRVLGLVGPSLQTDTVLFTSICAVAFLLSFVMFKTLRGAAQLLTVLFWTLVVVALFQFVMILTPQDVFGIAKDSSTNLVGKWNDLGILSCVLALMILVRLEFAVLNRLVRGALIVLACGLALLLGTINFPVAWALVLSGSVILVVVRFLIQRGVPAYALGGALVAVVFLFFGSTLNLGLAKLFPISSFEVRPSYSSTLEVINASRGDSLGRLIVGTGPNTFGEGWLIHKPSEINQSQFWNLDFIVGYSTFVTALGTVGVLGLLGWLVVPALLLAAIIRVVRLRILSREDIVVALGLSATSFALCMSILFYVPSQNVALLFFVVSGATFAFLWRQGQSGITDSPSAGVRVLGLFLGGALVVVALALLFFSGRLFASESFVNRGLVALEQNKKAEALRSAQFASRFVTTGNSLRLATNVQIAELQTIVATTSADTSVQKLFAEAAQEAVSFGKTAVDIDPKNYQSHIVLGNVYAFLATLKVEGALDGARESYKKAALLSPKNPTIALLQARLEAIGENGDGVQTFLRQSLTLKPDYTDAILMAVQIYVAKNDLKNAVVAAEAAVRSAPGIPSLWFQLGVLLWSGGDIKNAVLALERAIELQSNYANAKYFLGLSYWADSQKEKAIQQFVDIATTNPDNAEVQTTLARMRDGTQPLRPDPPTQEIAPVRQ